MRRMSQSVADDGRGRADRAGRRPALGQRASSSACACDVHAYGQRGVAARLAVRPAACRAWRASGSARPTCWPCCPSTGRSRARSYGLVWSVPEARAEALLAMAPADVRAGAGRRHRRRRRRAAPGQRARRLAAGRGPGRPGVRARLGAGRRRRAPGAPAGRPGPEPGPGRRGGAGRACWPSANPGAAWATSGCCAAMPAGAPGRPARWPASPTLCCTLFASEQPLVRELRNRGLSLVNRLPAAQALADGAALDLLNPSRTPDDPVATTTPRRAADPDGPAGAVGRCRAGRRGRDPQEPGRTAARTSRRSTRSARRRSPACTKCASAPTSSTPTSRATT